jgi:hypothetical protein
MLSLAIQQRAGAAADGGAERRFQVWISIAPIERSDHFVGNVDKELGNGGEIISAEFRAHVLVPNAIAARW